MLTPVFAILLGVALATFISSIPAPSAQPGFHFLIAELAILGAALVGNLVYLVYDGAMTSRYGATLGKRWMKLQVIRTDGSPIRAGAAFGRSALYIFSGFVGVLGLLDPLWCLWDEDHQCLHDKIVSTLVVNT